VALTEAEGAIVAGVVVTGVIPNVRTLTMLGGLATDTAVVVGEASFEAELLDSVTDERLLAAVSERWGTKFPTSMFSKWADVEKACDFWAEQLRKRLESLRAGTPLKD
jgi:acyl carrier protein